MGVIYVNDQIYSSNGIPKGGNAGQALIKKTNFDLDLEWADVGGGGGGSLPSGGTQGQVLTKNSSAAGDASWQDVDGLPSGGTAGQALIKKSSTDGDADWEDVNSLPSGGTSGQVLTKNSATAGDASWKDVDGLPSGGTAGQVLKKNSATAGDASWADPLSLGETNSTAYAGDKGKANADHIGDLANLSTTEKTNLVGAINELDTSKEDVRELTMAQFEALSQAEKDNGTAYYVTDAAMGEKVGALGFTPIGTIISVMGTSAPANYLKCDGTVYKISVYPELANYFEQQFGSKDHFGGDGTTTFAVPDLQGEFLRGTGTNSNAGQGSGGNVGEHQDATEIPNTYYQFNARLVQYGAASNIGSDAYSIRTKNADASINDFSITTKHDFLETNNQGEVPAEDVSTHKSVRPTNTSVLYCIACRNIYVSTVDDRNIYSTTEKIVGEWIDGKPLYQKTFNATSPAAINTEGVIVSLDLNIDKIIDFNMLLVYNNYEFIPIGWQYGSGSFATTNVYGRATSDGLRMSVGVAGYTSCPVYATIKYTKTTD